MAALRKRRPRPSFPGRRAQRPPRVAETAEISGTQMAFHLTMQTVGAGERQRLSRQVHSGNGSATVSASATGGSGATGDDEGGRGGDADASSTATASGPGNASSSASATGGAGAASFNSLPSAGGNATATANASATGGGTATGTAVATAGAAGFFNSETAQATSNVETVNGAEAQALSTAETAPGDLLYFSASASSTAKTSFAGVTTTAAATSPINENYSATTEAIAQGGSGQTLPAQNVDFFAISTALPDKAYATALIGDASNVAAALLGPGNEISGLPF